MLIVYIIGTTASGKTNLSLNLGQDYEIISCDSMQLYKEANIMTAKATPPEQAKVFHHGIDILNLDQEGFNRKQWRDMTMQKIQEIESRGKVPVLVGGTHYYIESILFQQEQEQQMEQIVQLDLEKSPYETLKEIDPLAAEKFHPNDHRRIMNSIKYFKTTGQLPSQQKDHHSDESQLRNNNFLLLWPKWKKKENLKEKVTERIHEMLEQGGTKEILEIFAKLEGKEIQMGGVLQSIGYRQFSKAYQYYKEAGLQYPDVDDKFKGLMRIGEEQLVLDTMHYTKKQLQWIKNRILCNSNIDLIANRLFILEFESADKFKEQVIQPAQQIYQLFKKCSSEGLLHERGFCILEYQTPIQPITPAMMEKYRLAHQKKSRDQWKKKTCELCQKLMNGPIEEEQHYRSRYHKLMVQRDYTIKKQKID